MRSTHGHCTHIFLSSSIRRLAVLAAVGCAYNTAFADISLVDKGDFSLTFGLEAGVGYFHTLNTNFGVGRSDVRSGANTGDAKWAEGYIEPSLSATYVLGQAGKLYSGVSGVGVLTQGDGDAGGFTNQGDDDIDNEHLFVGWASGRLFADSLGEDVFDISYGRQEFQVGDGFLIYDGDLDQFDKGAFWLAPRASFERAALLKMRANPVAGDVFYLRADTDQDNTELAGVNVEYVQEGLGTFGVTYFHVLDSTPVNFGARDGMDVLSLRVNDVTFPPVPNLSFWSEYVSETGSGDDGKIDADAWYAEAKYSFSDWLWSPTVSYRYASFSGSDVTDTTRKDFDPFFYGFSRGWGTWFQGEITGEYLLFNSNQINHMVHLAASPTDNLGLGAIYYKFFLDKNNYFGTPVTDDDFADEINLYADWTLNDNASISAVYGVAFPGEAARQAFGDNEAYHVFEITLYLSF